jgi:hypothetical protein
VYGARAEEQMTCICARELDQKQGVEGQAAEIFSARVIVCAEGKEGQV